MKTFNKLISFAIISMTSLTYTACSDGFFDRYPTDSMQMETYLKNDAELQNIINSCQLWKKRKNEIKY